MLTRSECQHEDRFRDGHCLFAEPFISSRRMPPGSIGQQHVCWSSSGHNGFLSSKRTCDQASHLQLSGPRRLVAGQAGYVVTTIAQATRLTIQRSSRSLLTFNCEASHCFFRPSPPKDERGPEALHPHPSLRWAVLGARPYCHGEGWQKVGVGRGRAVASDSGRLLKWALLKWTLPSSHSLVCHGQVVAHRKRQGTKCCMRDLAASPCALVFLSLLFKPRAPTLYLFELLSKTLSSATPPCRLEHLELTACARLLCLRVIHGAHAEGEHGRWV